MLPATVLPIEIFDASNSRPLINKDTPSAYPRPLFWTTKCEIVLSFAIFTVLPSSSLIVSPDKNLPDKVLTNRILPVL